jgi:hypothetical protein
MRSIIPFVLFFYFIYVSGIATGQNKILESPHYFVYQRSDSVKNYSAPDSLGIIHKLKPINKNSLLQLPYPVLFIHGFASSAQTWNTLTNTLDTMYGLNYGGRIDVCLNHDADNSTANLNFSPSSASDIAFFTGINDIGIGDYYYLNFNVGSSGSVYPTSSTSDYVMSNQSAVYKQGIAVKYAIELILNKTGREKVVVVGHSMGGLATRQYIQHTDLWFDTLATDGHRIAKLFTNGTPHEGSNVSGGVFSSFTDLDESSEAVRDLRRTYFYSGDSGVYLHGGIESASVMYDQLFGGFYNVDVNCNGITNEYVAGINDYALPLNIDYACVMGYCSGCFYSGGDGVVSYHSANLGNFYNIPYLETYTYYASALTEIHTDLPGLFDFNMKGMDEPDSFRLAYTINTDTNYLAFITPQTDTANLTDIDVYKFSLQNGSWVDFKVYNIGVHNIALKVFDASEQQINTTLTSNGADSIIQTLVLPAGQYYLVVEDTVFSNDAYKSYRFILNKSLITSVTENKENFVQVYPNPASERVTVSSINDVTVKIYDEIGKLVYSDNHLKTNHLLPVNFLGQGLYIIEITDKNGTSRKEKLIISR